MQGTNQNREQLREAVVGYLGPRCALNFDLGAIRRALTHKRAVDFEIDEAELSNAISFCIDKGFVKKVESEMGSTDYFQATAAGVTTAERSGWNL
jgi:hypothetical protein